MKGKIFIGTSGWLYSHWEGKFYPPRLTNEKKLQYFSEHFSTVEVNSSFYHFPRKSTYQKWWANSFKNFLFAIKVNRTITHLKRLKGIKKIWEEFLENALLLKEKLGPFLFQFPASFSFNDENLERLKNLFEILAEDRKKHQNLRFAFEFRHPSWLEKKIYQLLEKFQMAWVIADSPSWPKAEVITTNFVYLRFHGSKVLFASSYSQKELKNYAQKIKNWAGKGKDVYAYFNNDAWGYALDNARDLLKFLTKKTKKLK